MLLIPKRTSRLKYKACYRHCGASILKEFTVCPTSFHAKGALTKDTPDLIDAETPLLKFTNSGFLQNHRIKFENGVFCWKTVSHVERNDNAENIMIEQHKHESQEFAMLHNTTSSLSVKHGKVLPTQIRYIHQHSADRSSSVASEDIQNTSAEVRSSKAPLKSLKDIPGPFSLPWVGTSWMYWTLGPYNRHTFHQADEDLYKKYGPIYREQRGGATLVSIHRADDIERVFRQEGPRPLRVVNEALVHRRRQQPHIYPTVGLAEAVGEEWYQLRQMVAPSLLRPKEASLLLDHVDVASEALLEAFLDLCDGQSAHVADLAEWMVRYGAEAIWRTALGRELGALRPHPPLDASQLASFALKQFRLMAEIRLSSGRWKYWPEASPKYRQFARLDEAVYRLATKHISGARAALAARTSLPPSTDQSLDKGNASLVKVSPAPDEETFADSAACPSEAPGRVGVPCIMEKFLGVPGLDPRDANTVIIDIFSAGVTTTASSLVLLLHRLGQEPIVVQRLQQELDSVMDTQRGWTLTPAALDSMPYLKAVVMEGFRLTPIIPSLIRILPEEIIVAGYRIPAYTPLIAKTRAACLDEVNFSKARDFLPQRWLPGRQLEGHFELELRAEAKRHQFLVKPFGFGARMCVGKRLAEYEVYAALAKIVRNFDLSSEGDITLGNFLFLAPLHPVALTLTPRK